MLLALAALSGLQAPPSDATAAAASAEPAGLWVDLMAAADGTSPWRGYGREAFPERGWQWRDGVLTLAKGGGGGDLVTARTFANFDFTFEWRAAPGTNSGVMYKVAEVEGQPSYYTGPEYQVLDDGAHSGAAASTRAAALYGLYAPEGGELKPAGEWNRGRIVVRGARVEHWLNGVRVVAADFAGEDFGKRVAASKFAAWSGFARTRRGHLCLQDHGDEVAYRALRVRELPPEPDELGEPVQLFDGESLTGWRQHRRDQDADAASPWSAADGELRCAGVPPGYAYTESADYESFVLELEWRFDPDNAGNSGVLVRVQPPHRVWPLSVEAQLHSGNAGDFWAIGGYPMATDPARRKGGRTVKTEAAENPVGEWNRYRIVVDGPWVQLTVNGKVVNEAWDVAVQPGPIALQSEGVPIRFRDIRLRPLVAR